MKNLSLLNKVGLLWFIVGTVGFFSGNHDAEFIFITMQMLGGIAFLQSVL